MRWLIVLRKLLKITVSLSVVLLEHINRLANIWGTYDVQHILTRSLKTYSSAVLTLLRSQKHYEIFSNHVLRENITQKQKDWKQQRLRDYLARGRKGLIIDLSKENIFAYYV